MCGGDRQDAPTYDRASIKNFSCGKIDILMAWSQQFSNRYFSNRSYQKGVAYNRRGAVHLIHGSDRSVEATVQGTTRYNVFVDLEDNSFIVRCSCPWFEDTREA